MPSKAKKGVDVVKMTPADPAVVSANYETFLQRLLEVLPPVINQRLYSMYIEAWNFVHETGEEDASESEQWRQTLLTFQTLLSEVPNWDVERVSEETALVLKELPYLRECLRQMLIGQVSILMCVRRDSRTRGDFEFVMPPDQEIVHTFFCRVARRIRSKAKLYSHLVSEDEREENTLEAEDIIREALERAIPALVPLKDVVQRHLIEAPEEENEPEPEPDEEEDVEPEADEEEEQEEEEEESSSVSDIEEQVSSDDNEFGGSEDVDLGPNDAPPPPLAPEDTPADKTAAKLTVMQGDSDKEIKLKQKATELIRMIEKLEIKLAKIPKRQKSVYSATAEELEYRKDQLKRVKTKIKKS